MRFNVYGKDFVQPNIGKFSVVLICLIFVLPSVLAAGDVQQSDIQDLKEMLRRAEKLSRKGDVAEAEKILRRAVSTYPSDDNARLNLSHLLLKQKQLRPAYDLAFEVAKGNPKNAYALAILGTAHLNAGNFEDAKIFLYNAVSLNRKEPLGWAGLGMMNFYENQIKASLNNLSQAISLDRNEPDFVFAYAQVASRAEMYREAAFAYEKFLQISSRSDKERRDRILGLIKFLKFLGERSSLYEVKKNQKTIVPVKLVNDRPVIELKVNGKDQKLRFVLDTGSGISVISKETAKKLKISSVAKGGLARAIGGDGKFEIVYGFLNKIEIGDVKINSVPIYIREFHNNNDKIDGYIGLALISKFLTTIDYGSLSFALETLDSVESPKNGTEDLKLPLRLTSSGFLSGEVMLEGLPSAMNFIVDTGASISVISDDVADREEIRGFVRDEKLRVTGAAGVTEDVSAYLLPRVTFGTNSREKIKAIALDLDIINETAGFEQAGILGGNFLKNYRVTFDFQNSKVLFVPIAGRK